MKALQIYTIILIMFTCNLASAQIGVNTVVSKETRSNIEINSTRYNLELQSLNFAIDYEIGLKNYRVNFLPGLYYGSLLEESTLADWKLEQNIIAIKIPVRMYVLDIESDCNCPTFSKGSNFFSKGFYFEITPGYVISQSSWDNGSDKVELDDGNLFGAIGLGLDIGLSKKLTLTLMGRTGILFNQSIGYEINEISFEDESSRINEFGLSLRYYFKEY